MSVGILGKKIGMTQIFDENGKMVPVTVVKIEPTYVVQKRVPETDGYSAVQLGAVQVKKTTKAIAGHLKKAGVTSVKVFKEVRDEKIAALETGDRISLDTFAVGDFVNVTTKSIGKGFQGVIKRHHFSGGPASHGSMFHREPGGIGSQAGGKGCRKKVRKGRPLPGQMGNKNVTVQNLQIVDIDLENQLLVLKGSVPGGGNNVLTIINSFKKSPNLEWKVQKAGTEAANAAAAKDEAVKEEAPVENVADETAEPQPEVDNNNNDEKKNN
ncbi:MAG: 50S ribosomal protein L3 [Candidatus Omnitrophica bacterium]|nr:50S ribosomal protein L3 [Candidatus Omnitrophota bacterium]